VNPRLINWTEGGKLFFVARRSDRAVGGETSRHFHIRNIADRKRDWLLYDFIRGFAAFSHARLLTAQPT